MLALGEEKEVSENEVTLEGQDLGYVPLSVRRPEACLPPRPAFRSWQGRRESASVVCSASLAEPARSENRLGLLKCRSTHCCWEGSVVYWLLIFADPYFL